MSSLFDSAAVRALVAEAARPEYREFLKQASEDLMRGFNKEFVDFVRDFAKPAEDNPEGDDDQFDLGTASELLATQAELEAAKEEAASLQRQLTAAGRANQILQAKNESLQLQLNREQAVMRGVIEGYERIRYALSNAPKTVA